MVDTAYNRKRKTNYRHKKNKKLAKKKAKKKKKKYEEDMETEAEEEGSIRYNYHDSAPTNTADFRGREEEIGLKECNRYWRGTDEKIGSGEEGTGNERLDKRNAATR